MRPLFIRIFILLGLFLPALASANAFTICNQSAVPISAALARFDSDASTSTFSSYGWYNISAGACSLVSSTSTNYRFFYVYAEGDGGKIWNDSSMSNPACVDPINSFHIINAGANCATRSYQQKGFISVDTGNSATFTYNITATPAVSPALSLTGLWWNQNESGWGISLTQQGSMVFAAWFTYGSTGQPEWLVMSSCPVVENACMGDIYKVVGGTKLGVPWNGAGKVVTKVGVGTLIFADNNTGTLNYSVDGVSGTKQITRQIFESGSSQPAIDYSALWWNENESGWGVAITQQYGMIFAVMYTYDTSGNPVWYVASGCPLSGDNCTGDLYKVTGGSEPNVTWNGANKVVAKVGTVSFVFNDSSTGVMSYVINGVSGSKAISRQLFGEAVAATYQSAYDACYIGTPLLYTSNYCAAYANAIVAGSTPLVANQAGAVAAGSNVGNIGMGGAITATGTPYVPNAGPTPTPRLAFNLTSLTFSPQENFTTSAIQTVILSNVGNTGILLHSNITLPLFARWNIVNDTCIYAPSIFMAGASCTVSISFTPRGDDNIRNVYLLRKSLGENPSLPTSENYSGIFEVYGDSVTNPQVVVPKQAVQLNGTGVYPPDATPAPTVNGIAAFSGTYNIKTSDGTVATFTVDSNGNVSSCKVDSVVVCSGKLTLSLSTGEANFQIIGNDGLNPIDTTASFSGTINKNGDVSGGYLGNSVSEGGFSGTFTGSKAGGGAVTSECGVLGQIIEIRQSGPNMVNIPLVCRENRIDNWVSAPPEAGLSTQEICDRATTPTDELTGRPVPITKIKNMSACFCLIDGNFASGKQTKCWTYYDLAK